MFLFGPSIKKLKSNGDVNRLIKTLSNKKIKVQEEASEALIQLGEIAIDPLIAIMSDNYNAFLKGRIAVILGRIGDKRGIKVLLSAIEGGSFNVTEAQLEKLIKEGDGYFVKYPLTTWKISEYRIHSTNIAVIEALGNIGDIDAIEGLNKEYDFRKKGINSRRMDIERTEKDALKIKEALDAGDFNDFVEFAIEQRKLMNHYLEENKLVKQKIDEYLIECDKINEALDKIYKKNNIHIDKGDQRNLDRLPKIIKECQHEWLLAPDKACHICGKNDVGGMPFGCNKCFILVCHNCMELFETEKN